MFLRPTGLALALAATLAGCSKAPRTNDAAPLPEGAGPAEPDPDVLTGVGFGTVSIQPGETLNQRRKMAVRAARIAAMRDLAGQIHGVQLCGGPVCRT
ncbi:MAG: hypothetical protein ACLFTP_11080, partial [Rhodosalinus sp.]